MLNSAPNIFACSIAAVVLAIGAGHGAWAAAAPQAPVDFSREILPVLSAKCFHCHGPDEHARKAKLRLDVREDAIRGRDGDHAIKPGDPAASLLIERITTEDPDDRMPPVKENKPLELREIELIKRWIAEGAPYARHWAFEPPVPPAPPQVSTASFRLHNPIDNFVAAKLAEQGLAQSPPADARTLARRLALDLTGLPPGLAEIEAFAEAQERAPFEWRAAVERWVDSLLAAPAFGERWARVWLDLARYADSAGYGSDPLRTNIWPYRDWVIHALNRNLSFDRFTLEQLAGDLLPNAADEQRVATAFHRNTMTNTEGGTDDEEFRVAAVKDRVGTTLQVWMGLTMNCAQCHTHKFDPISQQEYYQVFALFNQTQDTDKPTEEPTLPLPTPAQRESIARLQAEITALKTRKQAVTPELEVEFESWARAVLEPPVWVPLDIVELSGAAPALDGRATNTVVARADLSQITALRFEGIPAADAAGPALGPARLNELTVVATPDEAAVVRGRYVRIELPGKERILSLAEVEVFNGATNVARAGKATQSSTAYDGPPERAIDGVTDGDYHSAKSTTHTAPEADPWWEVDLGSEQDIHRIAVWNRTDNALETRLLGFRVQILDGERKQLHTRAKRDVPRPSIAFAPIQETAVPLIHPTALPNAQSGPIEAAIDGDAATGWSVQLKQGQPWVCVFELREPLQAPAQGKLRLTFTVQQGGTNAASLGQFRVLATTRPAPVAELSADLGRVLALDSARRSPEEQRSAIEFFRSFSKFHEALTNRLAQAEKDLAAIKPVAVPVMAELPETKQRETRVLMKGNFLDTGAAVEPGI